MALLKPREAPNGRLPLRVSVLAAISQRKGTLGVKAKSRLVFLRRRPRSMGPALVRKLETSARAAAMFVLVPVGTSASAAERMTSFRRNTPKGPST